MKKLVLSSLMVFLMAAFFIVNPLSTFAESNDTDENPAIDTVEEVVEEEITITNVEVDEVSAEEIQNVETENADFAVKGNDDTVDITVEKVWIGKKLNGVIIHLLADQKVVQSVKLSDDNGWTYTFKNLARNHQDGTEINYSIEEEQEEGYETSVEGNKNAGFQVRNKEIAPPTKVKAAPPVQTLQIAAPTEEVEAIEPKEVEVSAEPKVEKEAVPTEKAAVTAEKSAVATEKVAPSEKNMLLATANTIKERKTTVVDEQAANTTEQIPQLGWAKESTLLIVGLGFILLALVLIIKRKQNKVA